MGEAYITRRGGSGEPEVLNGVIDSFKAYTDDVQPSTFVEFVNGTNYEVIPSFEVGYYSGYPRCIPLDDTYAIWTMATGENTANNIEAVLLKFDSENKTISKSAKIYVAKGLYTGTSYDTIRVDETRVLLVGNQAYDNTKNYCPYAVVLYRNGDVVSQGSVTYIDTSMLYFSGIKVAPTQTKDSFLIIGTYNNNLNLPFYCIVRVLGNNVGIEKNRATALGTGAKGSTTPLAYLEPNTYVGITNVNENSSYRAYAVVYRLEDNVLTFMSSTLINNEQIISSYILFPKKVGDNKVFFGTTKADKNSIAHYYIIEIVDDVLSVKSHLDYLVYAFFSGEVGYDKESRKLYILAKDGANKTNIIIVLTINEDFSLRVYGIFDSSLGYYYNPSHIIYFPSHKYMYTMNTKYVGVDDAELIQLLVKPYEDKIEGLTKTVCKKDAPGEVWVAVKEEIV